MLQITLGSADSHLRDIVSGIIQVLPCKSLHNPNALRTDNSNIWHHLFALGVAWEGVEWVLKYLMTPKGDELKFKRTRTLSGQVEYEQWWSSSSKDILFNGAGILLGLLISKKLMKK